MPYKQSTWEYCDLDELTTCFATVIDGWGVGIGDYNSNDETKEDQAWQYLKEMGCLERKSIQYPPMYDGTNFVQHTVEALETNDGYRFKLYDYTRDKIYFEVAWIKIGEYPLRDCDGALGLWLC